MKYSWLFLSLLLALGSCSIQFKNKRERQELPDLIMGDFKYVSASEQGKREWELKASQAKMYNGRNEILLYNMSMIFYNSKNQAQSFLSADYGFINKQSLNIYTEGNVKILAENQAILEANKVNWDNERKLFFSEPEEMVTLRRGNTVMRGYDMEGDSDLKEVRIQRMTANMKK